MPPRSYSRDVETDDRTLVARILNLEAYADTPVDRWRGIVLDAAYKSGLLIGTGFCDNHSAERAIHSALLRRSPFFGKDDFTEDDRRKLASCCDAERARGVHDGKANPKLAFAAFPEPDAGLFGRGRRLENIGASVLPGPFARLIEAQTDNTGLPTNYLVLAWLTAAAGLVGTAREVSPAPHTYSEPAILWTAVVGEPSDKKSPAIDLPAKLIEELDNELHPVNERKRKEYARDLARFNAEMKLYEAALKAADRAKRPDPNPPDKPDEPIQRRLAISNVTPEKLIAIFSDNPRGLIGLHDELPAFWRSFNTYAQGDGRQLALKAYGGRSGTMDRVKMAEPLIAKRCALSVLGGVQTDVIRRAIEKDENDGFFARFLYVFPSSHEQKLGGGSLPVEPVRCALRRLWGLEYVDGSGGSTLYLDDEARESFLKFRITMENLSRLKGPGLNGWVAKGPGTVLRIALVLELMAWAAGSEKGDPTTVSAHSFEAARELWEDCLLGHAEHAFGFARKTEADDDARRLAVYLAESGERTINASVIRERRCVSGLSRSEPVQAAFARLVDASIVFPNPARGGEAEAGRGSTGRGRLDYLVNPRINDMMARIGTPDLA